MVRRADRVTRVVDKKATKAARKRQAAGKAKLDLIFNGGDLGEARARIRQKRVSDGCGGSATRKHWTRPDRRARTKAQRIARRANRA